MYEIAFQKVAELIFFQASHISSMEQSNTLQICSRKDTGTLWFFPIFVMTPQLIRAFFSSSLRVIPLSAKRANSLLNVIIYLSPSYAADQL